MAVKRAACATRHDYLVGDLEQLQHSVQLATTTVLGTFIIPEQLSNTVLEYILKNESL